MIEDFFSFILNNYYWIFSGAGIYLLTLLFKKETPPPPPQQSINVNVNQINEPLETPDNRNHIIWALIVIIVLLVFFSLLSNNQNQEKPKTSELSNPKEEMTEIPDMDLSWPDEEEIIIHKECLLKEIETYGKWRLTQTFKNCNNPNPKLEWEQLIVYSRIDRFERIGDEFITNINKTGQNYLGVEKNYDTLFSVTTLKGYFDECSIIIPIDDIVYVNGSEIYNKGYFRFEEYEIVNGSKRLKGEFYHSIDECKGEIYAYLLEEY